MKIRAYNRRLVRLAHKTSKISKVQNVKLRKDCGPVEKWDCLGPIYEVDNRDVLGREFADPIRGEPEPDKVVKLERVKREIRTLDEIVIDPVVEHSAERGYGG